MRGERSASYSVVDRAADRSVRVRSTRPARRHLCLADHAAFLRLISSRGRETWGVVRVGRYVRNLDRRAFEQSSPDDGSMARRKRQVPRGFSELWRHRERGDGPINIAVSGGDVREVGHAKPGGRAADGVEYRLQIKSRAADDVEHFAGRGLVFDRLVALGSAFGKLAVQIGCELFGIG